MLASALEEYRDWLRDSVADVVLAWCADAVGRRYEAASAEFLRRTTDDAASRRYALACPVANVDHASYRLRELRLAGGGSVLAGVHFRGLSTEWPFVGVFAQSHWLAADETVAAHAALLREFAVFSPRATRWWFPTGKTSPEVAGAVADQHLVMGSLEEIRSTAALPLPSDWCLRRVVDASEVETAYMQLYRDFHRARPDLAQTVLPTRPEHLMECARADGLHACFAGSDLVGVVAAKPDAHYWVDAWMMWDIVLARRYCGQGFAPILERAVLDRLDIARAPLVAGTIDARNLPSLRTALRLGRRVVGSWVFIGA